MTPPNPNGRRYGTQADLRRIFELKVGQVVYLKDLMDELGATAHQVQGAIAHLMRRDADKGCIETVLRGQAWRWTHKPATVTQQKTQDKSMFVEVGTASNGDIIIESEDGVLYRATRL